MEPRTEKQIKEWEITRLKNNLKGQAMFVRDADTPLEEKEIELGVIQKVYRYVSHYDEYSKIIEEWFEMQKDLEDDGR